MPVRHCIAVGCTSDSRKDKDVRFYQLPKCTLKRWLNLIRREGLNVDPNVDNRHNVVCSKHFVDGCPTFENPLPTLFVYNNFKQSTPRKTKNSYHGRTADIKCNTNSTANEPFPKRAKLVKCHTDKTQLCYPYVSGEIDIPDCNTDENNNETAVGVLSYPEVTQDHEYMCRNPSGKYCREEELVERIRILEAKCEELHYENKRLREENEELKARKVNFREELLKKVLQDDNNVKHFLGLPSLCFFTTFLQFLSTFYGKVAFWKGAGQSGSKIWQC